MNSKLEEGTGERRWMKSSHLKLGAQLINCCGCKHIVGVEGNL